jgi:hypothetical protein
MISAFYIMSILALGALIYWALRQASLRPTIGVCHSCWLCGRLLDHPHPFTLGRGAHTLVCKRCAEKQARHPKPFKMGTAVCGFEDGPEVQ